MEFSVKKSGHWEYHGFIQNDYANYLFGEEPFISIS